MKFYLNSILHLDGFNLNVIIQNRNKDWVLPKTFGLTHVTMSKYLIECKQAPDPHSQTTVDASLRYRLKLSIV